MRVRIDPAKCQAHGECNAICPEVFKLDDWGYAYAEDDGHVPAGLEQSAANAVKACPENAISAE